MSWIPKQTVIVPIDFSEASYSAVDVARELVAEPSGLHVVHVIPTPTMFEPVAVLEKLDTNASYHRAADVIREHLSGKYADAQINILFGDPGTEIAAFAERVQADLVVMPSHGRSGLQKFFLGSVAERVLRLAHCPVLILRR